MTQQITCEISTEEIKDLLEENEKTYRLLRRLLEASGEKSPVRDRAGEGISRGFSENSPVNTKIPPAPARLSAVDAGIWQTLEEILIDEIDNYKENEEELRSLKYLCRFEDDFHSQEEDLDISREMIFHLQAMLQLIQKKQS